MKPRARPQQSLDNRAEYDRERRTFEGSSDIKSHPTSEQYRQGFDRIDWTKRKEPTRIGSRT